MNNDDKNQIFHNSKNNLQKNNDKPYSIQNAIREFDELKDIALNCVDKNGNPNINAALRAVENKAKIAGLYQTKTETEVKNIVKMTEITIDGTQLKLNIGEDFLEE